MRVDQDTGPGFSNSIISQVKMTGGNGLLNTLPILDSKNWERWHKQMKALFGYQETLDVVNNGVQELSANVNEAKRILNNDTITSHHVHFMELF